MAANDYEQRKREQALDDYVAGEVLKHYGKDAVYEVSVTNTEVPRPKRRGKLFSFLSIVCAVMFLTGVSVLSGVLFSGEVPIDLGMNDNSDSQSIAESIVTIETDTHTDISTAESDSYTYSSTAESDSYTYSSTAEGDTYTDSSTAESDTHTDSNIAETDTHTDSSTAENDTHTDSSTAKGDTHTYSSTTENDTHTESNTAESDSYTDSNTGETDTLPDRKHEYSLPETESGVIIEHSDNNSPETNPYDSVVTGRRIRAGVGISLTVLSLVMALVLSKLKEDML
ncbi:MAG: hypothetical protein IIZ46_04360 [Clostridia bacterium]|nr:hypothetical protein [Clostridia bacterium]